MPALWSMSCYHPHFTEDENEHRSNSAQVTQPVVTRCEPGQTNRTAALSRPRSRGSEVAGSGRALTCRRLVPGWASCRSAAGWTRSGGSCPRRRWWSRWAGPPRGGCWNRAAALAPPSSQRAGSRPGVPGFLLPRARDFPFEFASGLSQAFSLAGRDPTAASGLANCPQ